MLDQSDNFPLIGNYQPDAIICYNMEQSITQQVFLSQVQQLAELLPNCTYAINLCKNRYHFMLLFCALITKKSINILPPNKQQETLSNILDDYPDAICLSDTDIPELDEIDIDNIAYQLNRLAQKTASPATPPMIHAKQEVALAFTSGSTGKPKANSKQWRTLVGTAHMLAARITKHNPKRIIATVPAQHMYGLETSIMMSLQANCQLYNGESFFPSDIEAGFGMGEAILVTTPIHLQTLNRAGIQLRSVDRIISATAPLSAHLCQESERFHQSTIEEIYGFTEAGSVATRLSGQSNEWRLLDGFALIQDTSNRLQAWHLAKDQDIGDVIQASEDQQGFFLSGRAEDLLNIAGKRASLADLNQKFQSLDGIKDVAIFVPDSEKENQRPVAIVVSARNKRAILSDFAKLVDPVFIPRPLIFVDTIKRNETGKAQKQWLLTTLKDYDEQRRKS